LDFIIVTGLSGAGKSGVINTLEDIGFFCVDNMPPTLIPAFMSLVLSAGEADTDAENPAVGHDRIAVVTDTRAGTSFGTLFQSLRELKEMGVRYKILFITADDDVLVNRYKLTRRKHPLSGRHSGLIYEAIAEEREILSHARESADYVIDTSLLSNAECREKVLSLFLHNPSGKISVFCMSFGFKFGMPSDADLVFDVRCLPNPFYIPKLKKRTGLEAPVRDYVMQWDDAQKFADKLYDMIDFLLPLYEKEGKSQLVIAIGCTGGKHRSVVFAELLKKHLSARGRVPGVNHRDMLRN